MLLQLIIYHCLGLFFNLWLWLTSGPALRPKTIYYPSSVTREPVISPHATPEIWSLSDFESRIMAPIFSVHVNLDFFLVFL